MNVLHNYNIRRNLMGFLLLVIIVFGTLAVFADTLIKEAFGGKSSGFWLEIVPYSGYVALGAIILYIPLNLLDKRLYEEALKERKEKRNS